MSKNEAYFFCSKMLYREFTLSSSCEDEDHDCSSTNRRSGIFTNEFIFFPNRYSSSSTLHFCWLFLYIHCKCGFVIHLRFSYLEQKNLKKINFSKLSFFGFAFFDLLFIIIEPPHPNININSLVQAQLGISSGIWSKPPIALEVTLHKTFFNFLVVSDIF